MTASRFKINKRIEMPVPLGWITRSTYKQMKLNANKCKISRINFKKTLERIAISTLAD